MSNPTSASPLPSGYSPPLLTVTNDDHSAWIVIATALGMACVLIFIVARVVVRYAMTSGFGQDDWLLTSSVVSITSEKPGVLSAIAIIQSSVLLYGCSVGLGASMVDMPSATQIKIQKIYYTSNLFWVIAMGLSKMSVGSMLERIAASGQHKSVFKTVAALLGAWTVASIFAIALQCNLAHPWSTLHERCSGVFVRWQVISAFDIVTELLLLSSVIFLVSSIQTSLSRKAMVVAGFACRLPILIAIAFRLATFDRAGLTENPSLRETLFIVWTQTELNYSIISATIPSLLQFMRDLNTHFGGITEQEAIDYGTYQRSNRSFPMSILRSANKTNVSHSASQTAEEEEARTNNHGLSTVMARHPDLASKDSMGSNDSQKMIIQRETTYTVQYEE